MTPKDIRDIAAYWGAPATIGETVVTDRIGSDGETVRFVRGGVVISWAHMLSLLHQHWRDGVNIKLQLRPFESVTHQEWVCIYNVLYDNDTEPAVYQTWSAFLDDYYEDLGNMAIKRMSTIATYLQSIGVYVPGTIDPQYIELLP